MVFQKNHLLLRFLKLRLIVNGMYLYVLIKNKPVVVTIPTNPSRIVVTDGYHITKPVIVAFNQTKTSYFKVSCVVEDDQLFVGLLIMLLLYAMGATSGMIFLQLLSFLPLGYILFLYYFKRKEFIRIRQVH